MTREQTNYSEAWLTIGKVTPDMRPIFSYKPKPTEDDGLEKLTKHLLVLSSIFAGCIIFILLWSIT